MKLRDVVHYTFANSVVRQGFSLNNPDDLIVKKIIKDEDEQKVEIIVNRKSDGEESVVNMFFNEGVNEEIANMLSTDNELLGITFAQILDKEF